MGVIRYILLLMPLSFTPEKSWEQIMPSRAEKYIGHWEDKDWFYKNVLCDYLVVKNDSATLFLLQDMFHVICRPEYKDDTLLLYVLNYHYNDVSSIDGIVPPKPKSLFAKCYLKEQELHIIYTGKWFKKNIKELSLDTVVYKFSPEASSGLANTATQKEFLGAWYGPINPGDKHFDADVLDFENETVKFRALFDNQLYLVCKPKFKDDTLLLYIKSIDCGDAFFPGRYPLPKKRSLFAKCYIKNRKLHIIQSQKMFIRYRKDLRPYEILEKHRHSNT